MMEIIENAVYTTNDDVHKDKKECKYLTRVGDICGLVPFLEDCKTF